MGHLNRPVYQPADPLSSVPPEPYGISYKPPSVTEITDFVSLLRNRKLPGRMAFRRKSANRVLMLLISRLHELLNIWAHEIFPSDRGASILLDIPMRGDKTIYENYGGTSLIGIATSIYVYYFLITLQLREIASLDQTRGI